MPMKLVINDKKRINIIQKEFNEVFPFLMIEFFSKPTGKGGGITKKFMKNNSKELGEFRTVYTKGHISITPDMTVNELEQQFQDRYGLLAQVYRKSGKAWLQTTATDGWTLEKQNAEGEALNKIKNENKSPKINFGTL